MNNSQPVTESEVHLAADGIILSGHYPSIERVRSALGSNGKKRGSPNTVTKYMKTWREKFQDNSKVTLPGQIPEEILGVIAQAWGRLKTEAYNQAKGEISLSRSVAPTEASPSLFGDTQTRVQALEDANAYLEQTVDKQVRQLSSYEEALGLNEKIIESYKSDVQERDRYIRELKSAHVSELSQIQHSMAKLSEENQALSDELDKAHYRGQADQDLWAIKVDEARREAQEKISRFEQKKKRAEQELSIAHHKISQQEQRIAQLLTQISLLSTNHS